MLLKLLLCFVGIFSSYLLNGIAIESITTVFGEKIFTFYMFMVLIPFMFNVLFAKGVIILRTYTDLLKQKTKELPGHDKKPNNVPKKFYVLCALFYMGSMLSANASLAHINYPTQLILKSSKPIPILCCGFFFTKKKAYSNHRYISVSIIVAGVMFFMFEQYLLKGEEAKSKQFTGSNFIYGWGLVFLSLTFDGMLATIQDHMRFIYELDVYYMMYYINLYASIFIACAAITLNEFPGFYVFVQENPSVVFYLLLLGLTSAAGQNFIYYTVTIFGPLTCSVVTTTRKFFNILLSVILFSNVMSFKLWISVCIVFTGLVLDIWIPYSNILSSK